jgi:hypothetical protein
LHTSDLPPEQVASCSATEERIRCEAVHNQDKEIEEVEKMECESDTLNEEVGSSFHSYCHCLIGLAVTFPPLDLRLRLRDI